MMKRTITFYLFALVMVLGCFQTAKAEEWIMDTLSYNPDEEERFVRSHALDIGPDNTYHFVYFHRDVNEQGGTTTYYTKKKCNEPWTEPELVQPKSEYTVSPTVTVTPDNRVFVAYGKRNNPDDISEGIRLFVAERTEEGWETQQIPSPTDKINVSYRIDSDAQGNLHLVWIAQMPDEEEYDYTIFKTVYATNLSGQWETQPVYECYTNQMPDIGVSDDGVAHLVFNEINLDDPNFFERIHYATNLQPGGQSWEIEILETPLAMDVTGLIRVSDKGVHIAVGATNGMQQPNHTFYFYKEGQQWSEPVHVNQIDYGFPTGIDINEQGDIFITYITQANNLSSGRLVMAQVLGDDVQERVIMDVEESEYGIPEFNLFRIDHQDNFLIPSIVFNSSEDHDISFNSLYVNRSGECLEVYDLEVLFDVYNELGHSVESAVITFGGQQGDAGQYLFDGLQPGSYSYLVEKEGYLPQSGDVTLEEENIMIDIMLEGDETSIKELFTGSVHVYPNPADTWFSIRAEESLEEVEMYDISGKKVKTMFPQSSRARVSTSGMEKGVYILRVHTASEEFSVRLQVVNP